jgi:tetratricopeptide (TPR) repeat protein
MPFRTRALPLLLAINAFAGLSAVAREEPLRSAGPGEPAAADARVTPEARLETLWFARKASLEAGDTAAAASRIDEMSDVIRKERLDTIPWLARGFAYEGYEHLHEGNFERAREAFDIARRFDPRMPEAQTGYAWAALKAGRGVGQFLTEYRRGLRLRWEIFLRDGATNVYLIAVAVLCLAVVIVVMVLLVRYQAVLRHDVAERLPAGWPEGATRFAGWIVLLAPLLAWTGGAWILFYWSVLLTRYMTGKERFIAALACLSIIALGPLAAWGAATAEISSDPTTIAVEAALRGGYGADVIAALQRAIASNPDATSLRLLLANTYERADLRRDAFDEYHRILQGRRDDPRALNNLGNLYMRTGQTPQAIVYYTRAAEADPSNAVFYYNLSNAQNDALRLADAETSVRMVQQLDPNLARALVTARGRGEEITPIPATASAEEVWKEVGVRSAAAIAKNSLTLRAPTAIGAFATIVLIGWLSLVRGGLRAQTCVRCGEAFCGRCKRELGARECCAQCIHLFVKKEAIAPDVRAEKLRQVDRFIRGWKRRVRVATLILPGSGHMLAGSTMTGVVLLLAWLAPLSALSFGGWLVLGPSVPVLDAPGITTLLAATFMAILWGVANLFVPKPPR